MSDITYPPFLIAIAATHLHEGDDVEQKCEKREAYRDGDRPFALTRLVLVVNARHLSIRHLVLLRLRRRPAIVLVIFRIGGHAPHHLTASVKVSSIKSTANNANR